MEDQKKHDRLCLCQDCAPEYHFKELLADNPKIYALPEIKEEVEKEKGTENERS